MPLDVGYDVFKYILFQDPKWDPKTFDLARDYDRIHALDNTTLSPNNPDLKPFVSRGGKLLIYQGWADPNNDAVVRARNDDAQPYETLVATIPGSPAAGHLERQGQHRGQRPQARLRWAAPGSAKALAHSFC